MARAKGLENARLDSAVIYSGQDTLYRILCTEYMGAARAAGEISGRAEHADRRPRIPALWHGGRRCCVRPASSACPARFRVFLAIPSELVGRNCSLTYIQDCFFVVLALVFGETLSSAWRAIFR